MRAAPDSALVAAANCSWEGRTHRFVKSYQISCELHRASWYPWKPTVTFPTDSSPNVSNSKLKPEPSGPSVRIMYWVSRCLMHFTPQLTASKRPQSTPTSSKTSVELRILRASAVTGYASLGNDWCYISSLSAVMGPSKQRVPRSKEFRPLRLANCSL
ncbi:hypothetical protein BC835DRAFT_85618 [Cytidiella melzeri]|nr:hypothetical protein BC835DRAFT_85618 [Cytidiella melzeri]